jgi:hypothetical protein
MPSTQDVATHHEYRNIPIASLVESPTNPRKRFDEKTLGELAAYVPGHISGLLCPGSFCGRECLVARENGDLHFRRAHNV